MLDVSLLDDGELSALMKAMHEARFPAVPSDPIVWSAPFVVDLHRRLIEEFEHRNAPRRLAGHPDALLNWLRWRGRPEHEFVMRRIREDPYLRRLIVESDGAHLWAALAPFDVEPEFREEIMDEIRNLPEEV